MIEQEQTIYHWDGFSVNREVKASEQNVIFLPIIAKTSCLKVYALNPEPNIGKRNSKWIL